MQRYKMTNTTQNKTTFFVEENSYLAEFY